MECFDGCTLRDTSYSALDRTMEDLNKLMTRLVEVIYGLIANYSSKGHWTSRVSIMSSVAVHHRIFVR